MASFHIFLLGCVICLQCSATFSASLADLSTLPVWQHSPANGKLVQKDSADVSNVTKECANKVFTGKVGSENSEKVSIEKREKVASKNSEKVASEKVASENSDKVAIENSEKVNKSDGDYACVNLCGDLYRCTSLEMGLFELHFKGDKCLNYCDKKLVCNEIQNANSTDVSDIDDKFGITVRVFTCAENQRLDKNGICRNKH